MCVYINTRLSYAALPVFRGSVSSDGSLECKFIFFCAVSRFHVTFIKASGCSRSGGGVGLSAVFSVPSVETSSFLHDKRQQVLGVKGRSIIGSNDTKRDLWLILIDRNMQPRLARSHRASSETDRRAGLQGSDNNA